MTYFHFVLIPHSKIVPINLSLEPKLNCLVHWNITCQATQMNKSICKFNICICSCKHLQKFPVKKVYRRESTEGNEVHNQYQNQLCLIILVIRWHWKLRNFIKRLIFKQNFCLQFRFPRSITTSMHLPASAYVLFKIHDFLHGSLERSKKPKQAIYLHSP